MKFVNERTMLKILLDGDGLLVSITTKSRAYFFFLAGRYVGARVAPTTDPSPGIVEICGYEIPEILRRWDELYRVKLMV